MAPRKMVKLTEYIRCANAGMSKAQAGRELGVSIQSVAIISKKYGISFKDGRMKGHKSANELWEEASPVDDQPQQQDAGR